LQPVYLAGLVERLRIGAPLAEAPEDYWYGGDATGYADWPGMNGQISVAA
jgi:N-ethylmaleimide reductase